MAEQTSTIRRQWTMDGATSLTEAATMLRVYVAELAKMAAAELN